MTKGDGMKKLGVMVLGLAALVGVAACVPIVPAPTPAPPVASGPPVASKVVVGDSVASLFADAYPGAENDAVGGTTACDTAAHLPAAGSKVLVHVGGHSWGNYDAATWRACVLRIIDNYAGKQVFVATAPLPGAIYCADPVAVALAEAYGNPHTSGNLDYELRQRLEDANAWKLNVLPSLRPGVHIVDWRGDEHQPYPDCIHLTPHGADQAVAQAQAAGF